MIINFLLDSRTGGPHQVLTSVKKKINKKNKDIFLDSNKEVFFFKFKKISLVFYALDVLFNAIVILKNFKSASDYLIYGIYNISPVIAGIILKKKLFWFILEKPGLIGALILYFFRNFNIEFILIDKNLKKKFNLKNSNVFIPDINFKFWKKKITHRKKKYFNIVCVGNINKLKNYVNLVNYLSVIKFNFHLNIVGDKLLNQKEYYNDLKIKIRNHNKKNNSKIFLLGRKNKYSIKKILNHTDLFILPSLTEGLSISLLEAMSMSCICLVSNESNHSKIINKNNGFVFDLNQKSFAYNLNKIYNLNSLKKTKIRDNARTTVINIIKKNNSLSFV